MASIFAHVAVVIWMYFLLKKKFDFTSLLLGGLIIDIESLRMFFEAVIVKGYSLTDLFFKYNIVFLECDKGPNFVVLCEVFNMKLIHSLIGSIFILLPLSLIIRYLLNNKTFREKGFKIILFSVVIGLMCHLILDLPAHRNLSIFYPFKNYENNPFLFTSTMSYSLLSIVVSVIIFFYLYKKGYLKEIRLELTKIRKISPQDLIHEEHI